MKAIGFREKAKLTASLTTLIWASLLLQSPAAPATSGELKLRRQWVAQHFDTKAGALPFHTWIPDAAEDAPLPFMALMPAAFEKLLGIYFLARITLDLFALTPASWLSPLLMTLGAVALSAVMGHLSANR